MFFWSELMSVIFEEGTCSNGPVSNSIVMSSKQVPFLCISGKLHFMFASF